MLTTVTAILGIIKDLFQGGSFVKKWLDKRKATGEAVSEGDDVLGVAERFVQIFKAHGIERTQIPRLLGQKAGLNLNDVRKDENLIRALDENIINTTCQVFGVRREWLDGKDIPIYPYLWFDKDMEGFINFIVELKQKHGEVEGFVIKCPKDKLQKKEDYHPIAMVFRGKIDQWGHFSEESIWRYYTLSDQYYFWGYESTRLQLKTMVLIAWQLDIHIGGCQLPQKNIEDLVAGTIFPGPLLGHLSHVSWHPDDYIFANGESGLVTDHAEALMVRTYLEKCGGMDKLVSLTGPLKTPYNFCDQAALVEK